MGNKLYVGNIPFGITEDELKNTFASHGDVVEARIITDKFTGQSRGFGFVEMADGTGAQQAIEALNGSELGGRSIVVNEARPVEKRGGPGGGKRFGERKGGSRRGYY